MHSSDTYGYVPQNDPWTIRKKDKWQPLIESDDLGFFYAQEHVTPHIGFYAKPAVVTREEINSRQLDDPMYDYKEEVELAINRVEALASDGFQRDMVSFMDNKINIAGGMIMRLRGKYNLSLEAQVFYHYGYTSTELDVVILAWKEKVRHDAIRPTSLVQALGEESVTSFAGVHLARDWVPFIRVMPHAEYPSGSGCICLGIAQFIDEFLLNEYGDSSIDTTWDFEETGTYTFNNMMDLATTCGDSRLWGGMHFTDSVPDSYELCDGIGTLAYGSLMKGLLGEGTYADLNASTNDKYCDGPGDMFCE